MSHDGTWNDVNGIENERVGLCTFLPPAGAEKTCTWLEDLN